MKKILGKINPRVLLVHMIITLGYPAAKAYVTGVNRLQVFTDAMTIIGMVLLIGGVVYSLVLHGDYDISGFILRRGARRSDEELDYAKYKEEQRQKREEAFNYPLFLGILYLASSAVIAYGFL